LIVWFTEPESTVALEKRGKIACDELYFEKLLGTFRKGFESFQRVAKRIRLCLWRAGERRGTCNICYEHATYITTITPLAPHPLRIKTILPRPALTTTIKGDPNPTFTSLIQSW